MLYLGRYLRKSKLIETMICKGKWYCIMFAKKSFKMLKGSSEAANRRTDSTIIKTKFLSYRWSKPILAILLDYLCHKWPVICFVFRIHNLALSSLYWLIIGFVTRGIRQVPHVEQELLTLPEDLSSLSVLSGVRIGRSLGFCVRFCRSMFVFLSFFFWALRCLSFELRLPMTPLTSANFS
jgi:hypothetical protein